MLKIGVTGGIGSGKSTVCQLFEVLGAPVFNSDQVSKDILATDPEVVKAVEQRFGKASYGPDGPDRAYLADIVFSDAQPLEDLNAILHPKVGQAFTLWCEEQKGPYVLKEAAILFEAGAHNALDAVVVVSAPKALCVERVIQRDGSTRQEVEARMAKQMPLAEKEALADHLVFNDGRPIIPQVEVLHKLFRSGMRQ